MKSVLIISLVAGSLAVPSVPVVPAVPGPVVPTPFGGCSSTTQCFLPSPSFATGNCVNSCIPEGSFCTPACQVGYFPSTTTPINCVPDVVGTPTLTPVVPALPLTGPFLDSTFTCVRGCAVVCTGPDCPLNNNFPGAPFNNVPANFPTVPIGPLAPFVPSTPFITTPFFSTPAFNNFNLGAYPITVAQGDRLFCADGRRPQVRDADGDWTSDGVQNDGNNHFITCTAATPNILYRCRGSSSKKGLLGLLGLLGLIPLCLLCLCCLALLGCCKRGTRTGGDVMISTFDPVPPAHVHTVDPVCGTAGGPFVGHF